MIMCAVFAAAVHAAYEGAYCASNGIPMPAYKPPEKPQDDNSANDPWMWLPMFLIGLLG